VRFFFLLLISILMTSAAEAADIAVMGALGVRVNSGTTDLPNASVSNITSFSGGILGAVPLGSPDGPLAFRSGFLVTQRYAAISPTSQGEVDIHFAYVDIPLTVMYLVTPTAGLFAGPVVAMNIIKDCTANSSCGATNVKSVAFPLTVGLQAKIFNQIGAEVFYEKTSGDLSDHFSNYTSVGGNILFYFD
jgi:hypothetical protein